MTKEKAKALRKFDYKVIQVSFSTPAQEKEEKLDVLGSDGWELVSFHGESAVFKRLIA